MRQLLANARRHTLIYRGGISNAGAVATRRSAVSGSTLAAWTCGSSVYEYPCVLCHHGAVEGLLGGADEPCGAALSVLVRAGGLLRLSQVARLVEPTFLGGDLGPPALSVVLVNEPRVGTSTKSESATYSSRSVKASFWASARKCGGLP